MPLPGLPLLQAVEQKRKADEITAVLYPNDATEEGKELRLKQQFFFVSASLQDTIARYLVGGLGGKHGEGWGRRRERGSGQGRNVRQTALPAQRHWRMCCQASPLLCVCILCAQEKHSDLSGLPEKACFQMNDTHPTIAGEAPSFLLPPACLLPCLSRAS